MDGWVSGSRGPASRRQTRRPGAMMGPGASVDPTLRRLAVIRWVAIADALALVVLVIAAASGAEGVVSVLGPIHGVGFLILVFLCLRGAGEHLWGWWFPVLVVLTLGPPGSLIGELRIRRALAARPG